MRRLALAFAACALLVGGLSSPASSATPLSSNAAPDVNIGLAHVNHLVVIYMENWSFDSLYGLFPRANGLDSADLAHTTQVDLSGTPFKCLQQVDPHLTSPPLPADACSVANGDPFDSHFGNHPFGIDPYLPNNEPTIDLVHRYYQEQAQIDHGKMDKFAAVSDAKGLSMGHFDTLKLPLYKTARKYTLDDNFFHAAFGGSFLNHQWLIAARTPVFKNAVHDGGPCDLHTVLDQYGLPVSGKDGALTTEQDGDWAVNTIQPTNPPFLAGTPPCKQLPNLTYPNIGDELTAANISWAWYAGGWNAAVAGHPDPLFQYHHQPFNYFANYAPGAPGRAHLQDEKNFLAAAEAGTLPTVSFVKPIGKNNEHPGYADIRQGEKHALKLINAVRNGPNWNDTAIVLTYDENGGFWDHVPPPVVDRWGPGSRVPTLVISRWAKKGYIDNTQYDTTSILATIEHRWNLPALTRRDAHARDLSNSFIR
jgi:acid phosphatase